MRTCSLGFSVVSDSSPLGNDIYLMSGGHVAMNLLIIRHFAVVTIFKHSFYIHDKRLSDKENSVPSFLIALEQYIASPHATALRKGVSAVVQVYEEAVTTTTSAHEGKPST